MHATLAVSSAAPSPPLARPMTPSRPPIALPPQQAIERDVKRALDEDIGSGDVTADLLPPNAYARARVVTREAAVLCGRAWFDACFRALSPDVRIEWLEEEGAHVAAGAKLCRIEGPARALVTGERTALNFLQTLSGTATATATFADAIRGTRTTILDTRKTLPGLRLAQKYAVRVGGGANHRIGLFDGILIKENHIMAAGGIAPALAAAQASVRASGKPDTMIQIEVETMAQLEDALRAGAKLILLDNFTPERMEQAVRVTAGRAELEASGGIDLTTIRRVAETGVDRISIGALTKDIEAADLSMRFAK
jgi:nicotinate-nucleotide pyrophosphorylase (carboxylating)